MKFFKKIQEVAEKAGKEVDTAIEQKLLEEKANPTLPQHKGGPVPGKEKK